MKKRLWTKEVKEFFISIKKTSRQRHYHFNFNDNIEARYATILIMDNYQLWAFHLWKCDRIDYILISSKILNSGYEVEWFDNDRPEI